MTHKRKIFFFFTLLIIASIACALPISGGNDTATDTPTDAPVGDESTATSEIPVDPTATAIPSAVPPTETPVVDCTNDSEFVADVTVPDGTLLEKGVPVTKTWTIENDSDCTWTTEYNWVQIGGSVLSASVLSSPLSHSVAPGETVNISVEIELSPAAVDGELYQAQFQLHDPDGVAFGTHPFALVYASDGTAVCPVAYFDYLTYLSAPQGFCLLYPDTYTMNNTFADPSRFGVNLTAPHPGGGGEVMLTSLSINNEGPSGGLNSQQYSTQIINDWKIPGSTPVVGMVYLDGEEAYYTDELPGAFGNRIIIAVHDGTAYIMTLMPIDTVFPTQTAEAEEFWTLIISSFTWID
ncbi:MAG: hypothetical protein HON98_01000 [Chloroflexi bacterium]|jgi:hypothetical protein|nr:hypothetical protein [Chloroflexota bacterium]MBT3668888.1 hypothetical protein [Chloroflexota bacterium]MBT4002184.1 hypothetical protein [Chloroflexota bacterium]MBT4306602.1 hypothetical protein [Chloroflexota bacterium]MBT4533986.1 hypothetical protein [Chloroflexota bacterium]